MSRTLRTALVLVLVLAAGGAIWGLAGGSATRQATADSAGPHGGEIEKGELARYLNATEAAATSSSKAELVAEGRRLFRSSAVALDGESCQACHTDGGANNKLGVITHPRFDGDFSGPRDPPALWGVGRTAPYGWAGDSATLNAMAIKTVRSHFKASVSNNDDTATVGALSAKLVAYMEQLEPPRSAFDDGTLTAQQLRGEKLFQGKAGCIACHTGVLFTDNRIHDTGVSQATTTSNDPGAPPPPVPPGTQPTPGPFINTPQMRDLKSSAPYMHNGTEATLKDVVTFYNSRSLVSPLRLTTPEIDDLVAFLEGL